MGRWSLFVLRRVVKLHSVFKDVVLGILQTEGLQCILEVYVCDPSFRIGKSESTKSSSIFVPLLSVVVKPQVRFLNLYL